MKNKIITLALAASFSLSLTAQVADVVVGKILDRGGRPISGAAVSIDGLKLARVATNQKGEFEIKALKGDILKVTTSTDDLKYVAVENANQELVIVMDYASEKINYGFGPTQTIGESTGAVSTVKNEAIDTRSALSVGNSLYGNVLGLTTLQKSGTSWDQMPSMFIRGQKTLNGNNGVLVVVDGLERDNAYQVLNYLTPQEIESVTVLRDAAAVALYGFKGVNGVLNIVTKRGKYKSKEVRFTYDHAFTSQNRKPELADAFTYANALNEGLINDGKPSRYSQQEIAAFKSGQYPYYYPNVNWWDETIRDNGSTDIATLSFTGGGLKMRYYTMLNIQYNTGFIKNANMNDGYSTQEQFSKGNFRTNLDVDLTPNTKLQTNLMGVLSEFGRPALGSDNLMSKLYTLPAAAFPVKSENGLWGGNATWDGYYNPVALTQGRAYSKSHSRALYADMTLSQDLSAITKGLSASIRMGYDNIAAYWENHTKSYRFGSTNVTAWQNGTPSEFASFTGGADSEMSGDSQLDWQYRSMNFQGTVDWKNQFGAHDLYSAAMYSYKYDNNSSYNIYRCNWSWHTHYSYKKRYILDFTLMNSASNLLERGKQWHLSPTIGAAWVVSDESFMQNASWVNFLKLRTSFGILSTDNIPYDGYWYETVNGSGGGYPIQNNFGNGGSWQEGRLPSRNGTTEKSQKSNFGIDATFFNSSLTLMADAFYERRSDIWVSTAGQVSSILGASNPYANAGIVDSWGTEVGLDYNKKIGSVTLNLGGNFTWNRNKIIEMLEEPKAYDYMRSTGRSIGQIFGYQAVGYFVDEADIQNSPVQQFGAVKAGDIKYKDINGDNIINEFDKVSLGYNSQVPEIYYGFTLGAEWKGLGFTTTFQGASNYTAVLNSSIYRPLISNSTISNHYYENRWTPETPNSRYPRLSTETVQNNAQTSTIWLTDRSFLKLRNCEVYYKFPAKLVGAVKMRSAKIYARGVDLLCFDGIKISDPEALGDVYPTTRSIHLGLAVEF